MSNYNVPENNSLKKEIKKLLKLCKENDEESGAEDSYFEEPIEEQKLIDWEKENGIVIPESYKEWLRFSRKCRIVRNTAKFWGPDEFHSNYVPDDFVVIGEMVGDGEVVCFSKKTGKFILLFEGNEEIIDTFDKVIRKVINIKSNKPILSHSRYLEIMAKLQKERETEGE